MAKTLKKIWMDGKFVDWKNANIHIMTHALHYGTAIFEGMRCYETANGPAVFRMRDHYERLHHGMKTYEFKIKYSVDHLRKVTKELIRKNKVKSCYIRPISYIGHTNIGIGLNNASYNLAIVPISFGKYFGNKFENGITCKISSWKRISADIMSPHVKASANYLNSVLAKREAMSSGYDEAIMLTENGRVSDGSGENIFIVDNGELITPPLHDGVLKGITRQSIIEIAEEMSIPVKERSILRDEVYTADEVFLTGTAAEVTPVINIDRRQVGKGPGPLTTELRSAFFNIVHGKDERFEKWLDYVK